MSSLSRNSCAKAFGNWSRGKNFRPEKPRKRGGGFVEPLPPASLRDKVLVVIVVIVRLANQRADTSS